MAAGLDAAYKAKLDAEELAAIERLQAHGRARGIGYKIDPGLESGIVCKRDGALTGFMTVDSFGGEDVEAAAIADDAAGWDAMAAVLADCARQQGARRVLHIAAPEDKLVTEKLLSLGLTCAFTEYRMEFDAAAYTPVRGSGIALRAAQAEDAPYIAQLDAESFGGDTTTAVSAQDLANTRMILRDGQPAGKLRLDGDEDVYGIYGVVIEPKLRGQGIGGQALSLLLDEMLQTPSRQVYLEVDSQNPAAFHLYKKLGFRVATQFCYYPQEV